MWVFFKINVFRFYVFYFVLIFYVVKWCLLPFMFCALYLNSTKTLKAPLKSNLIALKLGVTHHIYSVVGEILQ